jgi:serine/threonine protein phosphatase PrpC
VGDDVTADRRGLTVTIRSDVGLIRPNNEDSYGHRWLPDGSLFVVVADGMGGHEAGEIASGLAVQVLAEAMSTSAELDPRERIYRSLLEANTAILDEGKRSGIKGMGTTAVLTIVHRDEAFVGLIGDSRLFHVRKGKVIWRTLDHTRVQMLVAQGLISESEARFHPESGMLTRALGHARMADGRPLEPDVIAEPLVLEPEDALVLSSDGLHDLLEDHEIGRAIAGKSGEAAAEELVRLACSRGGHDNITVAVIIRGDRASAYDPHYQPPRPIEEPADATYAGPSTAPGEEDNRTFELPARRDARAGSDGRMWWFVVILLVLAFAALIAGTSVIAWMAWAGAS